MLLLQRLIFPLILLFFCFLFLYRDSYHASSLEVVPDSVEYTAIAKNLIAKGSSKIEVDDTLHPSRYTPWFSVTVLYPTLLIFGPEPGNAIYGILLFSICCLVIIYFLFSRLINPYAALAGTLCFLLVPEYVAYSRIVMNDALSGLIFLIAFLTYLNWREDIFKNKFLAFSLGVVYSVAYLWRVTNLAVLVPMLLLIFKQKHCKFDKLIFMFPLLIVITLNSLYSYLTFGSFFRNGYKYWVAIPYDYLSLTFKLEYLSTNLELLAKQWGWLPLLLASSVLIHLWKEKWFAQKILYFYLLALIPVLVFYLFYFHFHFRFYLPIYLILIATGILLFKHLPKYCSLLFLFIILANLIWKTEFNKNYSPLRRLNVEQIKRFTPDNSIVISNLDNVYLNLFFDHTERRFIPISRYSEYANKIITPIKHPKLIAKEIDHHLNHRHPELVKTGVEAFRYVFLDHPKKLKRLLKKRPVYLDLFLVNQDRAKLYLDQVLLYYDLKIVAEGIYLVSKKQGLKSIQDKAESLSSVQLNQSSRVS